jgi:hypothetical protein
MNIVQLQDQLKNFSQDQLVREMQMPSGNAPQFLVLGEIMRRQKMQQDFMAQQAKGQPQSTVAEDAIAAAGVPQGGIASMARALAPKTNMAENTGVQAMASGGPVKKMAEGDKIVRGGMILTEQEDGTYRDEQGRVVRSVEEDLSAIPSNLAGTLDIRSGEQERTWGQRNIGDPLRSLFQPVGEVGRAIGQPVGQTLRDVGQPVGDIGRGLGSVMREQGPRFVLGPQSRAGLEMPPSPPEFDPTLARPGRFEPVGDGLGLNMLPPEVDPEYFARRAIEARPLSEILTPEVLSPEEARREVERMAQEDSKAAASAEASEAAAENALPMDTGTPLTVEDARIAVAQAAETAQTAMPTEGGVASMVGDTAGGGAGAGGGIASAGGMSSYEQELMDMLARREKAAEQDKWLALAQVGLNMMSSTQPTLLGAVGEAGLKGVEAARSARDQYDKDRLDLLGAVEQSRQARAAAAARAAGLANIKPINATILKQYLDEIAAAKSELGMLQPPSEPSFWTGAIDDPDAAKREELQDRIAALENAAAYAYATHGAPYVGSGAGPTGELDANLSD